MGVLLKDLEGVSKKSINPHAPPKKVEISTIIIFQEARKLSNKTEEEYHQYLGELWEVVSDEQCCWWL